MIVLDLFTRVIFPHTTTKNLFPAWGSKQSQIWTWRTIRNKHVQTSDLCLILTFIAVWLPNKDLALHSCNWRHGVTPSPTRNSTLLHQLGPLPSSRNRSILFNRSSHFCPSQGHWTTSHSSWPTAGSDWFENYEGKTVLDSGCLWVKKTFGVYISFDA